MRKPETPPPVRASFRDFSRSSRPRLVAEIAAAFLALSTLTRIALVGFHPGWLWRQPLALGEGIALGWVYDLLVTGWLLLPLVVFLAFLPERWYRSRVSRRLIQALTAATLLGWLFTAVAELFFFAEFDGRFNFVAVSYLRYPAEVGKNIWESYRTGWIIFAIALATWVVSRWLWRRFAPAWQLEASLRHRFLTFAGYAALLAVGTVVVRPAWARVSEDRALNEVALNGYYCFLRAALGSDAPYEGLYASLDEATVNRRLARLLSGPGEAGPTFADGSSSRWVEHPGPERPLNVVIVLEESFGSEFVGALHPRPVDLTPEFDRLAAAGTLLTHAYSTGNRTIRAIEATTSSLPPLPGASIVRRSQSVGLFTLPALLAARGYETAFIYGGRALFDGMGSYLSANGIERIVDQADMADNAFTTAWGVCDEAIFDRALVEMDAMAATGKPFYALVLSVSNHRPFTFPQAGLQVDPQLSGRENAVRYTDYALGRFMRAAHDHPLFENTLFVLMGDHGARVYGAAEIPLASYEVPILFIGPGIAAGERLDTLASSLDVPPTVLARMAMSYESKFFGQDVFTVEPALGRALVTHNTEIALMRGGQIAVLGLHASVDQFRYDREADTFDRVSAPDTIDGELEQDAVAYYAGADRIYRDGGYLAEPAVDQKARRAGEPLRLDSEARARADEPLDAA